MFTTLADLKGVICHMDDILVHGATQAEHDQRVRAVLQRLQTAGLTLNDKCEFSKTTVKFLGHMIDATGLHADYARLQPLQNSQSHPASQNCNYSWEW